MRMRNHKTDKKRIPNVKWQRNGGIANGGRNDETFSAENDRNRRYVVCRSEMLKQATAIAISLSLSLLASISRCRVSVEFILVLSARMSKKR